MFRKKYERSQYRQTDWIRKSWERLCQSESVKISEKDDEVDENGKRQALKKFRNI